jgi:polyhydroxybutyrate depolymerase
MTGYLSTSIASRWRRLETVLIAGVLVTACGGSTATPTASPSPSSAQQTSITINGQPRTYLLYVPPALDMKQPAPLVVALTGCPSTAATIAGLTNFDSQARTGGFIVVYPEPVAGATAQGACWEADNTEATTIGGDLPFMNQLLDRLTTEYRIDKTRIFAAGFSGGGILAHALACVMTDRFAAIASVAGLLLPKFVCQPSRPVSILEMHGTSDNNVPYLGSPPDVPPTSSTIQFWVKANGCPGAPKETVSGITTTSIWLGCRGGTVVRLDTVKGGHHQWFGSDFDPVPGEPNSTAEIWSFFSNLAASA